MRIQVRLLKVEPDHSMTGQRCVQVKPSMVSTSSPMG